jgi:hypothetical protein
LIQIREFSNYINPVVDLQTVIDKYNITNPIEIDALRKSFQIPDYATEIVTNVYKWRELLDIGFIDSSGSGVDYPFESGAHYIHIDKRFYLQRQDPPCEFVVISEELTLGGVDTNNVDQNKFLKFLQDPTFLNYAFYDITSVIQNVGSTDDILDILNYNGNTPIILEVSLADYLGEYELGKRDIAGGCIDLSALKQSDLGDDC